MIGFFPEIYPDELFYSWVSRYYSRSGYSAYKDAIDDIYDGKAVRPDVEFINHLKEDAKAVINNIIPMEILVKEHTMFPYYARFLPIERRKKAYNGILTGSSEIHNLLSIPTNKLRTTRHIRYCPLCAEEDREKYGETYIHRNHQLIGVDVCYRHRCLLNHSSIPISGKASPRLYPMDSVIEDMEVRPALCEREIELAEFVTKVFNSEIMLDNPVSTGDFLHSKMAGTPYRSVRGEQRNISLMHSDYISYYKDMPDKGITELWQIQKVLNGYRYNCFEICQIAMFLGISTDELVDMRLPEKTQEQLFDEKVRILRKKGLSYPAIAKEMRASINVVKPIGENRYGVNGRTGKKRGKGGVKASDWKNLDREMLPLVKETAQKIYFGDGGRPHRVNPFSVSRMLKLTDGRIKKMPRCMNVITGYAETQEHYWAREVIWAVREIKNSGNMLNWRHIRDLTNMKKKDLLSCLKELKEMDKDVIEQVEHCLK